MINNDNQLDQANKYITDSNYAKLNDEFFKSVSLLQSSSDVAILPKGIILYRAAETLEEHPTPRFCNDTYKFGVYFACGSPYLSETMCTEYNQTLIIGVYCTTQPIILANGKYSHRICKCLYNMSHVDNSIDAVFATKHTDDQFAEVFLTEDDVKNVKLIDSYKFTVQQSINKWGFDKKLESVRNVLILQNKIECALELGLPVELD